MQDNLKAKVLSSLIWKILERGGTQGIQFIIQIILARLLSPEDYGVIAIIMIFIALANVFVQSGFSVALIQKKDSDDTDFSSVFYLSLLVAGLMYFVLYFFAPIIADFYRNIELIKVLRVLSLTLFLGAFNSIQNTIIAKKLEFKKQFLSSLIAVIVSGIVGIMMAYKNFGVWALVYQQLLNQTLICILLLKIVKWRPKLLFSFLKLKKLFSFGSKLLLSSLLDTLYMNITGLLIGKIYSPSILGFYNRGNQFPQIIVSNFNGAIQEVMFPALSAEQENTQRVKEMIRRSIVTSSYIVIPLMMGLIVIAEPMIKILLTDKWLPSAPYLRIFCLIYAFWPLHTANLQAINALGRSDIFLKVEIIKKILGLLILFMTVEHGAYVVAIGVFISNIISSFINSYPNKKLLDYGYFEQIIDIIPLLLISILTGVCIYGIILFRLNEVLTIILQVILGAVIYLFLSYSFKLECILYIIKTLRKKENF